MFAAKPQVTKIIPYKYKFTLDNVLGKGQNSLSYHGALIIRPIEKIHGLYSFSF